MIEWWRRRQRQREAIAEAERLMELREFVYLDEVSVTSLLSSRLGKVPSEFTDSASRSSKRQINSSLSLPKPVSVQFGSSAEENWSEDAKVVSKATVQTGFRKLYNTERKLFLLRTPSPSERLPDREWIKKAISAKGGNQPRNPWVVNEAQLGRGRLVEVEVELQADPTFRLSAIASTFSELMNGNKKLFSGVDVDSFEKVEDINRVLQKLMAGLVPIKCRVTDYVVVERGSSRYLVRKAALDQISNDQRPAAKDFFLVGVAETGLFWKDIRRVLFTKSRFRLLCRLNNDELRPSWTAVKLTEVVGEVAPGMKASIQNFSENGLRAAVEIGVESQEVTEPRIAALYSFGEKLAATGRLILSAHDREEIASTASRMADLMTSVDSNRKAFQAVEDLLSPRFTAEVDRTTISTLRVTASKQYGLLPGLPTPPDANIPAPPFNVVSQDKEELFMDAEIIAIYW